MAPFILIMSGYAYLLGQYDQSVDFFFIFTIGMFGGFCAFIATRNFKWRIDRVKSYVILTSCWMLLPVIGSIPFIVVGELPIINAYFEATSGFTTTGATILTSISELGRPLLLWRSLIQWFGGLFTLFCIILIMAPSRIGGLPDRFIRLIDFGNFFGDARIFQAIRDIVTAYVVLTGACAISLIFCGMEVFSAICLSLSTLSTGGFVPVDGNVSSYQNPIAESILVLFMLAGGTSVLWHRMILQKNKHLMFEHRESYYLIGIAMALGFVVSILLFQAAGSVTVLAPVNAIREGIFTVVSLLTTTGFEVRHAGFTVLPMTIVLILAFVGGGTFSTAGGIKFYRIGGMSVQATRELVRLVYPHGIRPSHFGSQPYDIQLMKSMWSFFVVAVLVVALGSLVLALDKIDYVAALNASVASFSNIGTIYSPGWRLDEQSGWSTFAQLSSVSKLTLCFVMILGRLEVLVVIGMFSKVFWVK